MKPYLDWGAAGALLASISGILPPIVALLGGIYWAIQIYESRTMKDWRQARRLQKIAKLEAKSLLLRTEAAKYPSPPPLG